MMDAVAHLSSIRRSLSLLLVVTGSRSPVWLLQSSSGSRRPDFPSHLGGAGWKKPCAPPSRRDPPTAQRAGS